MDGERSGLGKGVDWGKVGLGEKSGWRRGVDRGGVDR